MIYFTKYAETKFDLLNKHGVYFTKEQIEDTVMNSIKVIKKDEYFFAKKEEVEVVYKKEEEIIKIITFYPTK
jgi:hypothetical protein